MKCIWAILVNILPTVLLAQGEPLPARQVDTVYLASWVTVWEQIEAERLAAEAAFDAGDQVSASGHLLAMRDLHQPHREEMLDMTRRSNGKLFLPATFQEIEACRYTCARMTAVSEAIYWMEFLTDWQDRQSLPPHPEKCACMRCSIKKARK